MRKYVYLLLVIIISGLFLNCTSSVPQNAFRVRTKARIHLFGLPLPISVPNPFVSINIKTTATPAPGKITEYNPGGAFVRTNILGYYDAVNAQLPAPWTAKAAPMQSFCRNAPTATFSAVAGQTYKLECKWNITIGFSVQPGMVDLSHTTSEPPPTSVIGAVQKNLHYFDGMNDLKVKYYRQIGDGEDYELDGTKPVTSVSEDGMSLTIPVPNYFLRHYGETHYKLLIVEDEDTYDPFVGLGDLDVIYPEPRDPCSSLRPDPRDCIK